MSLDERPSRRKDAQSEAVANGKLPPGTDQRRAWARRCNDVIAQHLSDLGGEDNCSAAKRSIIRRVSVMTVELERWEANIAVVGKASADNFKVYQRTADTLRRLLLTIGLERRAREDPETQSNQDYVLSEIRGRALTLKIEAMIADRSVSADEAEWEAARQIAEQQRGKPQTSRLQVTPNNATDALFRRLEQVASNMVASGHPPGPGSSPAQRLAWHLFVSCDGSGAACAQQAEEQSPSIAVSSGSETGPAIAPGKNRRSDMALNATPKPPLDRHHRIGRRKNQQRTIAGDKLLSRIDHRSAWLRRCEDVMAQHLSDLGGENNCSAAERSLARRASLITIELERLEAKFSGAGEASVSDLDLYQRTARKLLPLLIVIGLQRPPREVRAIDDPLFQKYLDALKRQEEDA